MKKGKQRILVVAPHGDDGTLGCGGAISRFVAEGHEVFYMAFCTKPKTSLRAMRGIQELKKATAVLGIDPPRLIVFTELAVREFAAERQMVLEQMIRYKKRCEPQAVFCPSLADSHQDHEVITREACRAFKGSSILGYELPWNYVTGTPHLNFFVGLEKKYLDCKIKALKCSVSQRGKDYMTAEFQRSVARLRGLQAGARYAEAFEVIRWVMP